MTSNTSPSAGPLLYLQDGPASVRGTEGGDAMYVCRCCGTQIALQVSLTA